MPLALAWDGSLWGERTWNNHLNPGTAVLVYGVQSVRRRNHVLNYKWLSYRLSIWNTEQGSKFLINHTKFKYNSKPKIFKTRLLFYFCNAFGTMSLVNTLSITSATLVGSWLHIQYFKLPFYRSSLRNEFNITGEALSVSAIQLNTNKLHEAESLRRR